MPAGKLDQRVTLQRASRTTDGGGGSTQSWSTLATVWAGVRPKGGREGLTEGRIAAEGLFTFTIRNRADLSLAETDRVQWKSEVYNIRRVLRAGGQPLYLEFDAERGVAQ